MKLLTAATAVGLALALPAYASPTLIITVYDDGVQFGTTGPISGGSTFLGVSDSNFSDVQVSAQGVGVLLNPELSTSTLQAEASGAMTGSHVLTVDIMQTGLDPFTGSLDATYAYNALVGSPGNATISTLVNGVAVDTVTLSPPVGAAGPDTGLVAGLIADEQLYTLNFNNPFDASSALAQLLTTPNEVPEAGTLALFGALLIAGGLWYQGRNRGGGAAA